MDAALALPHMDVRSARPGGVLLIGIAAGNPQGQSSAKTLLPSFGVSKEGPTASVSLKPTAGVKHKPAAGEIQPRPPQAKQNTTQHAARRITQARHQAISPKKSNQPVIRSSNPTRYNLSLKILGIPHV
ncbi:MAG: hypothetical protein AAF404_07415 [Pseudomonadota bacterium]